MEGVCSDSVSPGLDTAVMAVSISADPGLSRETLDRRSSKDVSIGGRGVLGVLGVRGVPGTTLGVCGIGGAASVFESNVGSLTGCGTGGATDGFESTVFFADTSVFGCFAASGPFCGSDFCVAGDVVEALRRPAKALNACSTDDFGGGFGSSAGELESWGRGGAADDGPGAGLGDWINAICSGALARALSTGTGAHWYSGFHIFWRNSKASFGTHTVMPSLFLTSIPWSEWTLTRVMRPGQQK